MMLKKLIEYCPPSTLKREKPQILIIICLMAAAYIFANAACVPALPTIQKQLHTSHFATQSLILVYISALGLSQIIYGPLSEFFGRKKVLIAGSMIFLLGSLLVITCSSITVLLLCRSIQGAGAGSYSVIGKCISSDTFSAKGYLKASVVVMFFSVISQMASPIVGGYLVKHLGWVSIFTAILLVIIITSIAITLLLPETISNKTMKLKIKPMINQYASVLTNKKYTIFLALSAASLSIITIYQVVSPFIFENTLHINSNIFGWWYMVGSCGFLLGCYLLIYLKKIARTTAILLSGLSLIVTGGLLMLLLSPLNSPTSIVVPIFIMNIGNGFVFPLSTASAVLEYKSKPGISSGLLGCLQMLLVAIISAASLFVNVKTPFSLGICEMVISIACIIALLVMRATEPMTSLKFSRVDN